MLRLDLFEKQHADLRDFWRHIIDFLISNNVGMFISAFTNEEMGQRISPELFALSESQFNLLGTQVDLEEAQHAILYDLGYVSDIGYKERIQQFLSYASSKEFAISRNEYYEIEESKKLVLHDIKELEVQARKEMKKFWNHIDTLIIDSYKQMLFDITGSDVFVQAFMKELLKYGMMKDLANAKRNRDYETITEITGVIGECIGDWVRDIEQLVGATE